MRSIRFASALVALAMTLWSGGDVAAKPPTLTGLFPAGAERGKTVSVKLAGTFDHWPTKCWVDGDGLTVSPSEEKGMVTIAVAADARPGTRWVRIHDQDGASSPRPFVVGVLPEVTETEPNDDPRKPQKLAEPRVTVNGRVSKTGDVDGFSVDLKAGDVLTADIQAALPFGSPMDAVLQVVSPDGFVLAQNDDDVGMDPRIVFEARSDGPHTARVFAFPATPDSSIHLSGSEAYIYRLTLTTGGFVDHAFPLAVAVGGSAEVAAVGPNVPSDGPESVLTVPPGDEPGRVSLAHPTVAGRAEIQRVAGPVVVEAEPNAPEQPGNLADQATVAGRIDPPGDHDAFKIALKKGDVRQFRAESAMFGLPLDAALAVLAADGKLLAEADDAGASRDAELTFTAPADGDYRVVVRDLHQRGGPRFAYLLSVARPTPDFALTIPADAFEVTPGKEAKIVATIVRRDGFAGEIEVRAEELPAGVEATKPVSKSGDDSAKAVTLELRASGDAPAGPFRIIGRSTGDGARDRTARATIAGLSAETERPWLTVLPMPKPTP